MSKILSSISQVTNDVWPPGRSFPGLLDHDTSEARIDARPSTHPTSKQYKVLCKAQQVYCGTPPVPNSSNLIRSEVTERALKAADVSLMKPSGPQT